MMLYLLRHGIAEDAAPGQPDHTRALTDQGLHQMRLQAVFLAKAGLRIERLFCSPYVRARQTAGVVAPALKVSVEEEPLLASGSTFDDVCELLDREAPERAMLVGHQPDLGRTVHLLTGNRVVVRTGTLVAVGVQRMRPAGGTLVGLYDPDVMAQVGHGMRPDAHLE